MSSEARTILIVDTDAVERRAAHRVLTSGGHRAFTTATAKSALNIIDRYEIDVALFAQAALPSNPKAFVNKAHKVGPTTVIAATVGDDIASEERDLLHQSGFEIWNRHTQDWHELIDDITSAVQQRRQRRDERRLLLQVDDGVDTNEILLGNSPQMEQVRRLVRSVASSQASVLILGESGVGKELVARSLHLHRERDGQFVGINCAMLPKELIEGELFGWERGAHSTATRAKPGLFEIAGEGTVLLDEIGELAFDLQAKLLRVLETRSYRRLGGTKELPLKARVVAATNVDLEKAIEIGRFRADLYYRINVVTIDVPPLRNRATDIPRLAYHFIAQINDTESQGIKRVEPELLRALMNYDWPGNVRELRNLLYRAILLCQEETLRVSAFPTLGGGRPGRNQQVSPLSQDGDELADLSYADAKEVVLQAFSAEYLKAQLKRADGHITQAAKYAGILRPNFKRLMVRYGVEVDKNAE